jgi:hypothetical protein
MFIFIHNVSLRTEHTKRGREPRLPPLTLYKKAPLRSVSAAPARDAERKPHAQQRQ